MGRIGKRKHIRMKLRKGKNLNPRELAGCYGKVRYSKQERTRALDGRPGFVHFYKCDFCPNYHLGRKPGGRHGKRQKTRPVA